VGVRRWWPRAGASPTGPSRSHALPPHRQVQLLWLLTVLVVVAVVVTGPWALRTARDGVHLATTRLVPASTALATATRNYAAGTAELVAVAQATDSQARSAGLPQLTAYDTAANSAWKNYAERSAHLPGEAKLAKDAELKAQQLSDAGVVLLTTSSNVPAAVASFTAVAESQQQVLGTLQRLYASRINEVVTNADHSFNVRQRDLLIISTSVLILTMIAFGIVTVSIRRRYRIQLDEVRRNDLESGLQRALEMVRTEPGCCTLVQHAIEQSEPTLPSELLLADSSRAHFRQVITTDPNGGPGCPVMSPDDCPATNRGQTQIWTTSGAIDACPHLQHRESGPCSAVCVPVGIAGKTVGVVHATGPDHHPPDESTTADLELIARKTGERIGILRAFNRSETQARTDPLTGLLNRRSLETAVRDLTAQEHPYAVAYGDLDHFKLLNDVHGHDTGDRALRLFARVLRDSVRPNDIAARYGGEEFVVVLPDCTIADAYTVIDRVRTRLADAQDGGTVPAFTVSFGLAPAEPHLAFGEIVEQADVALLQAKSEGRDRVVVATGSDAPDADAAPTPAADVRPLP
jgi:diguanylate cyclase (GGDEF)-like protein